MILLNTSRSYLVNAMYLRIIAPAPLMWNIWTYGLPFKRYWFRIWCRGTNKLGLHHPSLSLMYYVPLCLNYCCVICGNKQLWIELNWIESAGSTFRTTDTGIYKTRYLLIGLNRVSRWWILTTDLQCFSERTLKHEFRITTQSIQKDMMDSVDLLIYAVNTCELSKC